MHILIPAGGRGVRLRPLTHYAPKPLLPLGDRPILTRIVENVPRECPVTVLVSPALEVDFRRWQETLPGDRDVRVYVEPGTREAGGQPGGPAGPVVAIAECLEAGGVADDLVILMGDSLLPFTLEQFLGGQRGDTLRLAAYELSDIRDASRFGVVEIGDGDTVASFEEKPPQPRSPWVFMGCLYIPARLLPMLHEIAAGRPPQMGHLVAGYLERGERVEVYRATEAWHDIGTFGSYLEAHRALLSPGQRQSLVSLQNHLEGIVYVHPTAQVSGSRLHNCIVLAGAEVKDAVLTDCVVHPRVSVVSRTVYGKLVAAETEVSFDQGGS
jgi:glucose-1-phosphate thymidylyltransferase